MGSPGQSGLPSGSVTFLFTDIESSTRLLSMLGDRYHDVLDVHHETLRSVWAANGGHEVNTEGDSFFVSFASPDDAVAAAVAAQRALAAVAWPHEPPPRVRIGLHTGYARPRGEDYVALAVNQAARVVSAAHGGQVLLTDDTARLLTRKPPAPLVRRGRFRLRDFDRPVLLYGVHPDGWDEARRPPRARPADGNNLVAPLTALVDRRDELAWLDSTVGPGVLATVTGTGGGGKTRLVVEFGLRAAKRWPDGAWFVDLSATRSGRHVAEAVADAIGATAVPGAPALDDVVRDLEDRHAVLILDNCEHVLEAAGRVADQVLRSCAGVGVVATSRVPLGMAAERLLRLFPLPYDTEESPAVELFLGVAPDTPVHDVPVVRQLCEQLDGIPLALELAAARARTVPVEAILDGLRADPHAVESTDPTMPARHRSIQRVLDWSWQLLDERAQALLCRLSVLGVGFTQQTATVAGAGGSLDEGEVRSLLWTLLDHSLVLPDVTSGGSRYRVLTPVRSYALARTDPDAIAVTVRALAVHFDASLGPDRVATRGWGSEMSVELDNVRGIVDDLAGEDDELGQRLAWSIGRYHDLVNAYAACSADVRAALARFPSPSQSRVALLALHAYVLLRMGRIGEVDPEIGEAEALAARVGTPAWDEACVLRVQGDVALRRGEVGRAEEIARRGLDTTTDPRGRSRMWNLLGLALAGKDDLAGAADAFEHELATAIEGGLETTLAKTHGNIAEAALRMGMSGRAARHQLECLRLARANGEPVLVAYSVMVAARLLAEDHSQVPTAVMLHECAVHELEASGHALYGIDAEVRDDFRAAVAAHIGADWFADAAKRGRQRGLEKAAELADEVLRTVVEQERWSDDNA